MRIAVFGVGGIGGYLGGCLARSGEEVVFIARGANLQALRSQGLRVESVSGDFALRPVEATDDPRQVGTVDAVLVTVKAWQVPEAAEAMRPLLGPATCAITMQNGVEAPEQLAAVLGPNHVVGGVCRLGSFLVAPGHVRHTTPKPFLQLGEMDNRPSPRLDRLRQAFDRAGIRVELVEDTPCALWMKFLLITPWSGLGALTRAPLGAWRGLPETRRLAEQAMSEVLAVARARGVALPPDALQSTMALLDRVPPETVNSLQRDVMEGRPSEMDAQIGAVVRLGEAAGVATPLHAFLYACLLPTERRARGELEFPI